MTKNKLVPKRRFKEFKNANAWELRKLSKYTALITKGTTPKEKTEDGTVNFVKVENISNGSIYPITKINEFEHNGYLKRSKLKENDILFSIAGTLGRTAIVNKSILPANTNQALAIIRGYEFDTNFLLTSLVGHVVAEFIRKNPTVGAQPNLSLEQVGNLQIKTPSVLEQQQIGSFFKQLDYTIALYQRKLKKMKSLKTAYLSEMFLAEGEKKPKRRCKGFTDDWELRKLGEESDVRDGTHDSPKYFDDGYPLVTSKNLKDFGLDLTDVSLISSKDFEAINKRSKVDIGDILFGMIGTIGNPVQIDRDDFAIKNVALIKEQKKILNSFLLQVLKSPVFNSYIRNENAGGTQKFLALSKVRGFEFLCPNIEEQIKIGNFFKQIDNTIALHRRKLEKLKNLKKAYLNEMFV